MEASEVERDWSGRVWVTLVLQRQIEGGPGQVGPEGRGDRG